MPQRYTVETKRCRRCNEELPAAEFRRNAKVLDGLSSWCKECHREATRASRQRHGDRYNAERRGRVGRRAGPARAIAAQPESAPYLQMLIGDPCGYCGSPATDVDHIDADGPDSWENFTAACGRCNKSKQRATLLAFLHRAT